MPIIQNCNIWSTFDCPDIVREDVLDLMVMLSPVDTPFFSTLPKTAMTNVLHEWVLDSQERPSDPDNPVVECARESQDFDIDAAECPCRVGNQVHILRKTGDVSWLMQKMNTIGFANAYSREVQRKMRALAMATEFAIIHSPNEDNTTQSFPQDEGVCGSPNGCRQMDGLLRIAEWDETDFDCLTELKVATLLDYRDTSPCVELTPFLIGNLQQIAFHKGGRFKNIWVNSTLKRVISNFFLTGQERQTTVESKKLTSIIEVIETDFGLVMINPPHLDMPTDTLLATDDEYLALPVAYPAKVTPLAQVSNSDKFALEHALTLEVRSLVGLGVIRGVCTDNILYCDPCPDGGPIAPPTDLPRSEVAPVELH